MEEQKPEVPQSTQQPTYGPTGDGGYNTPYDSTVFYSESDIFQITIAALSEMCQPVPVINGADLSTLGDVCEHPSPNLILFASSGYTPEHISKYFSRGFQKIHIFSTVTEDLNITSEQKVISSTHDATTETALIALSKIDSRISIFSLNDMTDGHVKLVSNLNAVYIMDLVTCSVHPNYKSFLRTITHKQGTEFTRYLYRVCKNAREIGAKLLQLAVTFNGYELAEGLCDRYRGMTEEREILARDRVNSSPTVDGKLFVFACDLRNEIVLQVTKEPPKVKYIVLWMISNVQSVQNVNTNDPTTDPTANTTNTTTTQNKRPTVTVRVTVMKGQSWSEGDPTPAELIAQYCESAPDSDKQRVIAEGVLKDRTFLPFA